MTAVAVVAACVAWALVLVLRGSVAGRSDRLGLGAARALLVVVAPVLTLVALALLLG